MLYEYRHYQEVPGKMQALHCRFADVTSRIWERHGFRVIGFWVAVVEPSKERHYLLQWEN